MTCKTFLRRENGLVIITSLSYISINFAIACFQLFSQILVILSIAKGQFNSLILADSRLERFKRQAKMALNIIILQKTITEKFLHLSILKVLDMFLEFFYIWLPFDSFDGSLWVNGYIQVDKVGSSV